MININYFISVCLLISLFGCGLENQRVQSESVKEEMKNREIKRISEAQILEKANELGNLIALKSQEILSKNLINKIESNNINDAIVFCNENSSSLIDSLRNKYGVTIKRVSLKNRNPENQPNELESQIIDAYLYNIENNIELSDNVQILENKVYFTRPITIQGELCLKCHGTIGKEINEVTQLKIKELYPNDKAVNYHLNDFRGVWSIIFEKENVVKAIQ